MTLQSKLLLINIQNLAVPKVGYLYEEFWAGDIEFLWGQEELLTGHVLQDYCKVDQAISHHVLILGWKDLLAQHLDCKKRDRARKRKRMCETNHQIQFWI